ncbi:MAG: 4-(cytidine 5'-diphospho)-2-C-methyl-D-erythritol kinase [Paracoccus sp. (in: a-proteobacteria)]|uniref:4-(cytidine 5'-diphospho)-2-C-methyl-D-erythritol kinase n=1 Tax=Paracoccus sp. TaxID=267 RepID=UPI0026E03AC1|nr:4-(cytidine 5'-diphospho)-2-C-methyl-D-erythritol kinase [Paracoccus sp. (in: a-proteobacteria)]MDO5620044.1 4-(cytidine 5'-diphospho)-2-C-methyl-D-erythritol kinase [Paracoccus sp. (in: a-proteobacteria)]
MVVTETARAKINLTLHVTGQRADGYHLLDSLVVFAEYGDVLTLRPGAGLTITGPFAAGLDAGPGNLCLRALALTGAERAITLDKRLPVASGIGGGSADAAAVLRGLGYTGPDALTLGADVPVCVASIPARMRGVGEVLEALPNMPALPMLLVNPGVGVSTPAVFKALKSRDNPPMPALPAAWDGPVLIAYARACRNDLEPPALTLVPEVGAVLAALRGQGADLARMSGSGATCFGLFLDDAACAAAGRAIAQAHPGWWVQATRIATGANPAEGLV